MRGLPTRFREAVTDGLMFSVVPAGLGLLFGRSCFDHRIFDMWVFGILFCVVVITQGILIAATGYVLHRMRAEGRQ